MFKEISRRKIVELKCELVELVQEESGAQVMHIANDDPENVFCLSFRTLPPSSNGVAHILEHTVLCGSRKFPVKDPFFAMRRRSLNTFMNAMTGSDFTCYPAASQVKKDFYNLLEVYLDAVFYPTLSELSFRQEGHRLEFEGDQLEYRGIVYNEMKGSLISSTARLMEEMGHHLFPDTPYGFNSGGDPRVIPDLTYEELLAFHRDHYHPSRCLFFFYGNMPLEEHLDFISEKVLEKDRRKLPIAPVPMQPRFLQPKQVVTTFPASKEEDGHQTMIAFGWLTCHILEQVDWLALSVLELILLDTDASILKKALLQSKMCNQVIVYTDGEINEVPFVIVLKGCEENDADAIQKLIWTTLEGIVKEGIDREQIDNAMHQLELHRSEITGDHYPFGLTLFMRGGLLKQHEGDPVDGLAIHECFKRFRQALDDDPSFLTKLIEKYFLTNTHFVRLVMNPDEGLSEVERQDERQRLDMILEKLSEQEKEGIQLQAKELDTYQKTQETENLDVLPKVTISDVPKACRDYVLERETVGSCEVFHHPCFTNQMVYIDLTFDLPELSLEELSSFRLFSVLLPQLGCGGRNYVDHLNYVQAHTGGVGVGLHLYHRVEDSHVIQPSLSFKGKALDRKRQHLFTLIQEMVQSLDLTDHNRIREVIRKHYTNLRTNLTQQAMGYAIHLAEKSLSQGGMITNLWYGIDYYLYLKELMHAIDDRFDQLIADWERFRDSFLVQGEQHLLVTCHKETYQQLQEEKFWGLTDLPRCSSALWKPAFTLPERERVAVPIASPVAFTAQIFPSVPYVHPDAALLNLAASLFDHLILHPRIREQGGAYGAGAGNAPLAGKFYLYAFRDPNIATSFAAFREAMEAIAAGQFSETDLEESKFELIGGMDAPLSPGSQGDVAYEWFREGKTRDIRQQFRDRLLGASREDVIRAVKTHLIPQIDRDSAATFASENLINKEKLKLNVCNIL
ncbi:MAG: insulinase family protein [Chlamydiia bacterium]|nr:insulinase family protein [Chlamydiia bacterium]